MKDKNRLFTTLIFLTSLTMTFISALVNYQIKYFEYIYIYYFMYIFNKGHIKYWVNNVKLIHKLY
jgi:hypothetical protein